MEDTLYRRETQASRNAASGSYVSAMVEAGLRVIAASEDDPAEKERLTAFLKRVQEITQVHPDMCDEPIKQRKLIEAIREADPDGESKMLQQFLQTAQLTSSGAEGSSASAKSSSVPSEPQVPPRLTHSETMDAYAPRTPLHAHIASIRQVPNSHQALRQRLAQLIPGGTAAQMATFEQALDQAIDVVPDLLMALATASQQAGIAHLVGPILQQSQQYFFETYDLIPDPYGILGLMDDAYLVHGYLAQLNQAYRMHTGLLLVPYDSAQIMGLLRAVLGPVVAQRLDETVAMAVGQAVQQSYYQQLMQQGASMQFQSSRTGGPGSWGGSSEDEIARLAAEAGISLQ